jgi:TolA-binding protein
LIYSYQFNLRLGNIYLSKKDFRNSKKYFNNALNLAESDFDKSITLYFLGHIYLLEHKPDSARKYLGKVLDYDHKPSLNFLYNYGVALFQSNRYEDALSVLSNIYQQLKIDSIKRYQRPFWEGKKEKWRGNRNELLSLLGLLSLQTNRNSQANVYLAAIPETVKVQNIPEANYLLALIYYQNGDLFIAESTIERLIRSSAPPQEARQKAELLLGTIQLEQDQNTQSAQTFEAMIQDTARLLRDQAYLRAGFANFRKRKYDFAIRSFQSLYDNYPNSDLNEYGLFYLVETYLKLKKNRLAIEKNRELESRFPKSRFLENTIFDVAKILYQDQAYNQALREFKNFLKLFPGSNSEAEALFLCALSAIKTNDEENAEQLLQTLLDNYPAFTYSPEAYYQIGKIQLANKNFVSAKKNFTRINSGRFYPYSLKGIGDINFSLAKYDSATEFYQAAESSLIHISALPAGTGLFSEGATQLSDDTLLTDIRFALATTFLKMGKYHNYIEMLNTYLIKYPQSYNAADLQFEIGLYYFERKEFTQAISQFYKVFTFATEPPLVAKTYLFLANSYLNLQMSEQAVSNFNYIITNLSDTTAEISALNSLAEFYSKNFIYDSAINCYLRLINKYPQTLEAQAGLLNLAGLYQKLGKTIEAKTILDRLIKEYPKSAMLEPAYLQMVELLIIEGNLTYAETLVVNFNKKFGQNSAMDLRLGKIRYEQNQFDDAKKLFLKAAAQLKKDEKAEALINAADAAIKLNDYPEAKKRLKQANRCAESEKLKIKCRRLLDNLDSKH